MEVGISHTRALKPLADEFSAALQLAGISPDLEEQELGPFAAIEWLVPTAIAVVLTRKYFETLATEAAKEHYPHIREGFRRLLRRVAGPRREVRIRRVVSAATPMKASEGEVDGFSVYLLLDHDMRIKFLISFDLPEEVHVDAVDSLHRMVAEFLGGAPDSELATLLREHPRGWRPVLLRFDSTRARWTVFVPDRPPAT